jgi:hydrogenase/urease accessory protein HupE
MNAIRTLTAAGLTLLPAAAMAHPGTHPDDLGWDLVHAFTQPDHLLAMAFVAGWAAMVVAVGYWFKPWRADSWRR